MPITIVRRELIAALGGAVAWPLAARAQGKPVPVVGYLHPAGPEYTPNAPAFLQGLGEAGYVEGRDVAIEYRWAEGLYDRLPAMAAALVDREVALIAAVGLRCALAAKEARPPIRLLHPILGSHDGRADVPIS
jgi:putative ABC transport system substrate-binding protein